MFTHRCNQPVRMSSATVPTMVVSSERRQPARLENKTNTVSERSLRLQAPHQLDGDGQPRRARDHLLPATGIQREDLELFIIAVDHSAEQEPARRAGDEHVPVESAGIFTRLEGVAPKLVA